MILVPNKNIYASYLLGRIDVGALRVIGGVRYEYTDFKTSSNFVTVGEEIVVDGITYRFVDETIAAPGAGEIGVWKMPITPFGS